jgi:hypothetical protein
MMRGRRRVHLLACFFLFPFSFFLSTGCHTLRLTSVTENPPAPAKSQAAPTKYQMRLSQYVFYSDFELDRRLPLFGELARLRDQVYKELELPAANTVVHVYLFKDQVSYERFMKVRYPKLPNRRAFFVAQPRGVRGVEDLLVYTYWGSRIQEDLRHELTHALLHSVMRDVPLWLDEGLAEYYEVPPGWKGVNYQHLDRLRRNGGAAFGPDLERLERLDQVAQMAPAEYREAWAWVHFMLHSSPATRKVLVGYLKDLRTSATPGNLRPRLADVVASLDRTLEKHLAQLDESVRPVSTRK